MSSSGVCVWGADVWESADVVEPLCVAAADRTAFCLMRGCCPDFLDADEWELVAVPKCLKTRPNDTGCETCLPDQPVASTLEDKPRKQWTLRLKSVTDYKMSAICAALRGLGVDYELEEAR